MLCLFFLQLFHPHRFESRYVNTFLMGIAGVLPISDSDS